MTNITFNINVNAEPISRPINKFYPFWVYTTTPKVENAKIRLENAIKEVIKCQ